MLLQKNFFYKRLKSIIIKNAEELNLIYKFKIFDLNKHKLNEKLFYAFLEYFLYFENL